MPAQRPHATPSPPPGVPVRSRRDITPSGARRLGVIETENKQTCDIRNFSQILHNPTGETANHNENMASAFQATGYQPRSGVETRPERPCFECHQAHWQAAGRTVMTSSLSASF